MAIRYDKQLNARIRKTVKNYNRRLKRLHSRGEAEFFKPITAKELKRSFENRNDLLYSLDRLERVRGDREAIDEVIRRDMTRAKHKLAVEVKRREEALALPHFGLVTDPKLLIAKAKLAKLRGVKRGKLSGKNLSTIAHIAGSVVQPDLQARDRFYENYFGMIKEMAEREGYPMEKFNQIKNKLGRLSPDELLDEYNEGLYIRQLVEVYHFQNDSLRTDDPERYIDMMESGYTMLESLLEASDEIVEKYRGKN